MNAQTSIQSLLHQELIKIRIRNPAYSLRAYSKKLGISHSALSEILNGKRNVSKKLAQRLAQRLCLSPEQVDAMLFGKIQTPTSKQRRALELAADHFHIVSDWYYFAILSLCETKEFPGTSLFISDYFELDQRVAQTILDRLVRLGLLKFERGKYRATGKEYASSDGVGSVSVRKHHFQTLELAKASLEEDPLEERDFTSMTMAIDPKNIPEARKLIRKFRDDLSCLLEVGEKKEVYKLSLQLFSLKHKGRKHV